MGKTSSAVTNRYHAKVYDKVPAFIPKGFKDKLKKYCEEHGTTVSKVLVDKIMQDIEREGN